MDDEQNARRIANQHRADGQPRDAPETRGNERVGTPSRQSENAPGSPEASRGTKGAQGKPMRDEE